MIQATQLNSPSAKSKNRGLIYELGVPFFTLVVFFRDRRFSLIVTKSLFTIPLLSPDKVGKGKLIFKESIDYE